MGFAEVEDRLYAVDPDEFMALRTEQVAAAKAAGDKTLAKEIGQLRKPTRSAWLVNLLARAAGDELAGLLDLGAALREAQQKLDAAELRALSGERSKAVNALSRRAVALGAEAGYTATEAARQEVAQTLQAALADPEQTERVRRGVLNQALSYGGFGTFGLAPAPAKTATPKPAAKKSARGEADAAEATPSAEDAEREAAREAARVAWEEAKGVLADAEAEADRVTAEADTLADQVEDLRRQLDEAERAEDEARQVARQARKRVGELTAAERDARELVDD